MAIWQYTFHILPKEGVDSLSSNTHLAKGIEGFEDELYWKLNPIPKIFFNSIHEILPKTISWSNEIDLYGNEESTCFEVLSDNENIVLSVSFRIDFRNNYEKVLNQIIEFCIYNGLVILDEGLNIVPLNYEQLQNTIEDSPQLNIYHKLSQ